MFSSDKIICCLQILDTYMKDIEGNIGDIKKWSDRLKSLLDDEEDDSKYKRDSLLYIKTVWHMICVYDDAKGVLNVDDILTYIKTPVNRGLLVNSDDQLVDLQSEVTTILRYLKCIHYTGELDDKLAVILQQITTLIQQKNEIKQMNNLIDAKHGELVQYIKTKIGAEHVATCACSKEPSVWTALLESLSDKTKPHASCKQKITEFLGILAKNETDQESELVKQLEALNNGYVTALTGFIDNIKASHKEKWNNHVVGKVAKLVAGLDNKYKTLPVNNKTDFINAIRAVFKECYLKSNIFVYKLETF